MHDDHKENQAAKLEQLFWEVSNPELRATEDNEDSPEDFVEIDVLQLPPRSEVHKGRKVSIHLSFDVPLLRFILVISVLIAVAVILYGFYGNDIIDFFIS